VTGGRAETDARSGRREVAEGLDTPALKRYFAAHVGGFRGRLHAELLHGVRACRAERIPDAARGWALFWKGRLRFGHVARGVGELLDDIEIADANHATATAKAVELWQAAWPDVLCTVPSGARRATEGRAS
jgi:hypothetical protein